MVFEKLKRGINSFIEAAEIKWMYQHAEVETVEWGPSDEVPPLPDNVSVEEAETAGLLILVRKLATSQTPSK